MSLYSSVDSIQSELKQSASDDSMLSITLDLPDKGDDGELADQLDWIVRDGSGWDDEVLDTIKRWRDRIHFLEYLYDLTLDSLTGSFQRYNTTSLVFSGLSTLMGFIDVSSEPEERRYTVYTASGLSFLAFVSMTILRSKNITERIKEISKYITSLTDFVGFVDTEVSLPTSMRKNARDLLKALIVVYNRLLSSRPNLTKKESLVAQASYLRKYPNFVNDIIV